ncbi:hypothetical protein CDD81_609 [Ophiocordyceps australis]|uniref:Uncharacterized protein n=1 Tax=Ophiocordyceps australis TaxID=1399860 RepID=A0A2C5YGH6_9HYPO|nr:hypothetical protein CDD81_609 [Ophiocordyceps australis]
MHLVSEGMYSSLFRPPPAPRGKVPRRPPTMLEAAAKRRRIAGCDKEERDEGAGCRGGDCDAWPAWRHGYTLAGQVDMAACGHEEDGLRESMYSDASYRRLLGSKRRREEDEDDYAGGCVTDPARPTPLFAGGMESQTAPLRTWSSVCLTRLGGMVDKVWQFCTLGSFAGFHAGGGRGYTMSLPDLTSSPPRRIDNDDDDDDVPAVKRRQTAPADDLCRNWIMVDSASARPPRPLPASNPSTASFASPRSPLGHAYSPASRPCSSPRQSTTLVSTPLRASHRRTHATASTASSRAAAGEQHQLSPRLDAEARALTMQRKLEERETEVRMATLNRRLQDMIRQGKEALGTRVQVEDEGEWEDEL